MVVKYTETKCLLTAAVLPVGDGYSFHVIHSPKVHCPPSLFLALCVSTGSATPLCVFVTVHTSAGLTIPANGRLESLLVLGHVDVLSITL